MAVIFDKTYGEITVRRHAMSRHLKLSVHPSGNIVITAPLYTPLAFVKLFIKGIHNEIGNLVNEHRVEYVESQPIGKSHQLIIQVDASKTQIIYKKPLIRVYLSETATILDNSIQQALREKVKTALKTEAKAYLPRRVEYLAKESNFKYLSLRFSHAKSRWGSCSSQGVISLNIGLMKLDYALIDYVIIHELAHTIHMNHSKDFWQTVALHDLNYKIHRKLLKNQSPHI